MIQAFPRWTEFTMRLEGPEGCDFQMEPGRPETFRWRCDSDHRRTKRILTELGHDEVTIAWLIERFEAEGGGCDCEVLFNVIPKIASS